MRALIYYKAFWFPSSQQHAGHIEILCGPQIPGLNHDKKQLIFNIKLFIIIFHICRSFFDFTVLLRIIIPGSKPRSRSLISRLVKVNAVLSTPRDDFKVSYNCRLTWRNVVLAQTHDLFGISTKCVCFQQIHNKITACPEAYLKSIQRNYKRNLYSHTTV